MADTAHPRQRVGAIADEGGALDRLRDLTVLDQVGLAGREDELAVGDVDLPAAEVDGVETAGDGADDVGGIVLPGQHEGIGHARHGRMRVRLAPAVAGGGHAHEPGIEAVLHVAAKDAVLDQDSAPGDVALVVDVERPAPVGDGAVVDHGHEV